MDHLESFIADCDRRTELAKKRLAETQEEISAEVSAKVNDRIYKFLEAFVFLLYNNCFPLFVYWVGLYFRQRRCMS